MTAVLEEDFVRSRPAFDNVVSFVRNKLLVGTPEQAALRTRAEHINVSLLYSCCVRWCKFPGCESGQGEQKNACSVPALSGAIAAATALGQHGGVFLLLFTALLRQK